MGHQINELFKNNNLYDRVNKLLVSYQWSDCNFLVCGKVFRAHKLILGISSPVFEAMFYGPLASNNEIIITDIESNTFQLMLSYIYTDKVDLKSVEDAYELLYASRKYMLEYLSELCITYIQSTMSIDNVITILNYPDYVQNNQLILSALKLSCQHASFLLDQKQYISIASMQKILESNEINMSEKDLIKSVFKWSVQYCEQNDIPKSLENRRDILINKGLFKLLRFHVLSLTEFKEIISDQNNIISTNEADDIKSSIQSNSEKNNNNANVSKIRRTLEFNWRYCLRSPIKSEPPVIIGAPNHIIYSKIKTNKSVFIKSLNIQSRTAPMVLFSNGNNLPKVYNERLFITIICEDDNSIVKKENVIRTLLYDTDFDIMFTKPVLFKKDVWYKVCFQWPKTPKIFSCYYAVQSRDKCYNNGRIQFDFEDVLPLKDSGSFLKGFKFCM